MRELAQFDGIALAGLIRARHLSAAEVLEGFLARVAVVNPQLNAVTEVYADAARGAVKAGLPEGPFTGVPFLVKHLVASVAGEATTAGSALLRGKPALQDSFAMARARAAGLVLAGRSTTSEFGLSADTVSEIYGVTRNPWDLGRSPGGSSGGSAAAVAAGLLPLAQATDGGGSIRIPAACCGLFGLKPSRARISAGPEVGEGLAGFAVQGVVSRSVRDTAAYLDAVAGAMPGDPYAALPFARPCVEAIAAPPSRLRIGFSTVSPLGAPLDPEMRAATESVAELLRDLGHNVEEAAPAFDAGAMAEGFLAIFSANCAATIARITGSEALPATGIEPLTRAVAEYGRAFSVQRYINHQQALQREARRLMGFFNGFDIWLTPSLGHLPGAAPQVDIAGTDVRRWFGDLLRFSPFAWLCNITGQPAMSVPLETTAGGLPIGLHFAARNGEEPLLLALAAELEQASPWAQRRPVLSL